MRLAGIKLIILDLDGTLLDNKKEISYRNMFALERCRQQGIQLVFATGRSETKAWPYLEALRPEAAVLSYGAHIMVNNRTVMRRCMSPEIASAVLMDARHSESIRFQGSDGVCWDTGGAEGCRPYAHGTAVYEKVASISVWGLTASQAIDMAKKNHCSLSQLIGDRWCNFSAKGVSKKNGIRHVFRLLGLNGFEAIGFGDESCDIGYFELCRAGIAMSNADNLTLASSNYQTGSNNHDGVATFLEDYILSCEKTEGKP